MITKKNNSISELGRSCFNKEFRIFNLSEKHESFPHAFCVLKEKLYFCTLFNNLLYEVDLNTLAFKEYIFPIDENSEYGFRQAVEYKDRIFFIPERGKYLTIFHKGDFFTIASQGGYASCVVKQENLYLLDRKRCCVDIFDMSTCSYIRECLLPNFDNCDYYIDINVDKDFLYISCGVENRILRINTITYDFEWLETDNIICHGVIYEGKIYYTSTKKDLDGIYAFDIEQGYSKKLVSINYKDKKNIQYYRFWNPKMIAGYIYFCPHEESRIIRYCLENNEVEYINTFDIEAKSLRPDKSQAVYGVDCYEDKLIIMPYYGNEISVLSMSGTSWNRIKIPVDMYRIARFLEKYLSENEIRVIPEGLISLKEYIGVVLYGGKAKY